MHSFFSRLDALIVITSQLKRLYIESTKIAPEKVFIAPDGVDLDRFQIMETQLECRQRLGLPLDRQIIGYIGRFQTLGAEKGIPELVQAMKHLIKKYPDNPPLLLCVGGPMDCVPYYQSIAEKHNVPMENLKFVDRVPIDQVPYWIRACDVVAIPFPWNEHMAYYTSPMKLFEYMAVGVPIVASDLPSLREVLKHDENAILVKPGDPESLAKGIQTVLSVPNLARRIAQQAKINVRKYTWESRARIILNAISEQHNSRF